MLNPLVINTYSGICKGPLTCNRPNKINEGISDLKRRGLSIGGKSMRVREVLTCANHPTYANTYSLVCESEDGEYLGSFVMKIDLSKYGEYGRYGTDGNLIGTYEWIPDGLGSTDEYDEIDTDGVMGFLNGIEVSNGTK